MQAFPPVPSFPGLPSNPFDNPFLGFLEESDIGLRANLFSRPETRGTPARSRFFQNQFADIQNQFLGQLGAQIRGGEAPTLTCENFLNDFDLDRAFSGAPPSFRGDFRRRFDPRTRQIFF